MQYPQVEQMGHYVKITNGPGDQFEILDLGDRAAEFVANYFGHY